AVWLSGRSVALESLFGRSWAKRLQQSVVGTAREVPGRDGAGAAQRTGLRRWCEVSRAGKHALRSLLPGRDSTVSVPSGVVPRSRVYGTALSVLDLRKQESGREVE